MRNFLDYLRFRFPHFFWNEFRKKSNLAVMFVFFYEIILGFLIYPLFSKCFQWILNVNGYFYITDRNWKQIITNPLVIIPSAMLLCFHLLLSLFQSVSLITLASDQKIYTLASLLKGSIHTLHSGLKAQTHAGKIMVIAMYPILHWYTLFSLYYRYHLDQMLKEHTKNVFLIIFFVLLLLKIISIFVYPSIFIDQIPFQNAFLSGFRLFMKDWFKNLRILVFLFLIGLIFPVIAYFLLIGVLATIVSFINPGETAYGYALTVLNSINSISLYIISTLTSIISVFAAVKLYEFRKNGSNPSIYIKSKEKKPNRRYMVALVFFFLFMLLISLTTKTFFQNGKFKLTSVYTETAPEVIAHRGLSSKAPENTLSAIQAAIDAGSDRVEIDVQLTKDGEVVLMHDKNTKRTTDTDGYIYKMTLNEVKELDAGSWFSKEFQHETVPTLQEVLLLCGTDIDLKIELKPAYNNEIDLAETVVKIVEEYNMEQHVIISSFHAKTIEAVHAKNRSIATGLLARFAYGSFAMDNVSDTIVINTTFISEELIQLVHASGKRIFCWTVNSKRDVQRLVKMGVDGIITDYPVMCRETIYEERIPSILVQLVENLLMAFRDVK